MKYPSNIAENKIITSEWYLDIFDEAATLYSLLHGDLITCSFWMLGVSDDTNDSIVLLNLSKRTLRYSLKSYSVKDPGPSSAIDEWLSRVVKRLAPISLMLERSFAVVDPSDIKLYSDNKRMVGKMSYGWKPANNGWKMERMANNYDLCHWQNININVFAICCTFTKPLRDFLK